VVTYCIGNEIIAMPTGVVLASPKVRQDRRS
jgi:hypothetical protein